MKKNYFIMLSLILGFVLFYGFFFNLGSYPLLDVDETRYVTMARDMFHSKDFLTLYLNGQFFFEKPPLFFWLECLSFRVFNVSELSARLPVVLLSILPLGLLIAFVKKAKNTKLALYSALVLLTSLEYIIITKIAILDSVLTSFLTSSIICYFFTFYVEEKNKKYFWILFYVFCALATLAKGMPGFLVPFLVVFVSGLVFKTTLENLKYSIYSIFFFIIVLPWHIIMLKTHGELFFGEYIIKHHVLRFLGSKVIHRTEPWYFYILTLLWGLFPHIFTLFKFKKPQSKLLTLNLIAAGTILIFFSLSGAKLITYILPVYPFAAVIMADIWIKIKKEKLFISTVVSMSLLSGFLTPLIYQYIYSFGQNDLMEFVKFAKENNYKIACHKTGKKYSLLYYSNQKEIDFDSKKESKDTILITRNKNIDPSELTIVKKGKKYSIVKRLEK